VSKTVNVATLLGKDLAGFKVAEMIEVYRVNDDGRKTQSVGFFKDPDVATAFAEAQTDPGWHKTGRAFVLTNGTFGYVIGEQESVRLMDDEKEAGDLKKNAVAKLSPARRKLLGF
jgi:hypothetical protein